MKQISQPIINSTKSLLGRLTKVTTMGCILALVLLGATSAQPKPSGTARPFKGSGLMSFNPTSDFAGTFEVVGNATHLGKFVGNGTYEVTGVSPDGSKVFFHVAVTWTAANGDSIQLDMPQWVNNLGVTPATSTGVANIIGGTGRFANASGSFFGDITPPSITPGVFNTLTAEGTISY